MNQLVNLLTLEMMSQPQQEGALLSDLANVTIENSARKSGDVFYYAKADGTWVYGKL